MIKCLETFGKFLEFVVCEGLRKATEPFYTGACRQPQILVSCRFQKSKTHVFMSIDMVCRLKKITDPHMRTNMPTLTPTPTPTHTHTHLLLLLLGTLGLLCCPPWRRSRSCTTTPPLLLWLRLHVCMHVCVCMCVSVSM